MFNFSCLFEIVQRGKKSLKINDIKSKLTSRPLIQLKTLLVMNPNWFYDTGATLTVFQSNIEAYFNQL